MRQVDSLIGVPVCAVLTLWRWLSDIVRSLAGKDERKCESILFVKLAEQGATVIAYPAIKRAVDMVGAKNVYFLVFDENRFILDVLKIIPEQNVIALPTDSIGSLVKGTLAALKRIRALKIDAAVDFEFFARSSAILTYLTGAKTRVGLYSYFGEGPWRGDLMTHRLNWNPHIHAGSAFQVMVEAINVAPAKLPSLDMDTPPEPADLPQIQPTDEELASLSETIATQAGVEKYRPLVLLNSNASDLMPLRKWESSRYIELAKKLLARSPDVRIAFTGGPGEATAADGLVKDVGSNRCFSMAGKTTLSELLTLYCLADVMVTNDSGPAHFATLTPIKVVTLFGPETPAIFGAVTPNAHVIHKSVPCSPCVSAYNNRMSACPDNICMQRITVDEVFDKVCELLGL